MEQGIVARCASCAWFTPGERPFPAAKTAKEPLHGTGDRRIPVCLVRRVACGGSFAALRMTSAVRGKLWTPVVDSGRTDA